MKNLNLVTFAVISFFAFAAEKTYAADCLNLQSIGDAAAQIEDLEVRTDIIDIDWLDAPVADGRLPEKFYTDFLNDKNDGDVNNFFFSIKNGRNELSFPKQSSCEMGSIVEIPESTHMSKDLIVQATPNQLILYPSSDSVDSGNGLVILKKLSDSSLAFTVAFNFTGSYTDETGTYKSFSFPTKMEGVISWGSKGTLKAAQKSPHLLDLHAKYKINE